MDFISSYLVLYNNYNFNYNYIGIFHRFLEILSNFHLLNVILTNIYFICMLKIIVRIFRNLRIMKHVILTNCSLDPDDIFVEQSFALPSFVLGVNSKLIDVGSLKTCHQALRLRSVRPDIRLVYLNKLINR